MKLLCVSTIGNREASYFKEIDAQFLGLLGFDLVQFPQMTQTVTRACQMETNNPDD